MLPTRASSRRSAAASVSAARSSLRSALRARSTASLALRIGAPLVLLVQALASCGSDDPTASVCVPNETQACTGPAQCVGFQVCAEDGKSFGACDCGSGGGNGGSSSGSGGSAGGGGSGSSNAGSTGMGGPLFPGAVGIPCDSATACPGAPMVCIQESSDVEFQFGGPQGGYCSVPCTVNTDCTAVDADSACNTALGYCLALCQHGPGGIKCGSGRAQYCVPVTETLGACLPGCTSDAACGEGRFCDPGFPGLCVSTAPPGGAVGAPCTVETAATDCASGLCLEYADPNDPSVTAGSFCSANCTAGVANGCGFDAETAAAGGVRQAACFEPQFQDGAVGDIGVCFPLCDTTEDCAQANVGWTCLPFPDPAGVAQIGRQGECVPPGVGAGAGDAGPG